MIGRRINPATGETVDVPETEHYIRCDHCGGAYDMRDLEAVLAHAGPLPHPAEGEGAVITSMGHNGSVTETVYDMRGLPRLGPVILERHSRNCECSYCSRDLSQCGRKRVGLNLPRCRAWNSWRVICWRTLRWSYYLRWSYRRPA